MTDQEILEEYKKLIEEDISRLVEEKKIESDLQKQYFSEGYREGFIKGFRKGLKGGKKNMAIRMLAKGIGIEEVSELIGLSIDEINSLS